MIRENTIVTIRYTMKNSRGEVLENRSITYLQGTRAISSSLQSQLQGLETGEQKQVFLKKGQEEADDDFTFDIIVEAIREATPEEQKRGTPITPLKIHLLSGFLGSGKTTAIHQACRRLANQNIPVAVITNDQGVRLVDGELFTHLGIPSGQVINGCFCCNYNDLDLAIRYLLDHNTPSVIFAESVGSCTDLIATVLKPLLQQHPEWHTTATVFADAQLLNDDLIGFDESINYIYHKQLEEAKLIVVSKIDQLENTTPLKTKLQNRYKDKIVLYQDSFNEEHIARWLHTLDTTPFTKDLPSLAIDYDTYGAGEAKLAWLDQQLEITSPDQRAQEAAVSLIKKIAQTNHPIGHLKFLLDGHTKISITATGATDYAEPQPAATATLLINARIQTDPQTLGEHVAAAIAATEKQSNSTIHTITESCFQPGYPRPTHRVS
jgi:CobW/HypB/UreG, nucleotide-binding domain